MSQRIKLAKAIFWAYLALAGGYILYGFTTKTGLYALLIDEQLKRFGKAEVWVTMFVPMLAMFILLAPLGTYIRRKEAAARLQGSSTPAGADMLRGPAANPENTFYWIWIGAFAVLPFLISLGAYAYLTAEDAGDQKRSVYHMDLAKTVDLPAGDVKFVEIAGVFQQDAEYDLQEVNGAIKSGQRYGPLTNTGWNPGQPVKYFLYLGSPGDQRIAIGHFDKQTGRYEIMPPNGPFNSTFGGQISRNGLPDYVKAAFERRGITTTDPYYVLEWKGDLNGPVASKSGGQMYYLMPFLGGFFSLVVLTGGAIAFLNRKRQRERAAGL